MADFLDDIYGGEPVAPPERSTLDNATRHLGAGAAAVDRLLANIPSTVAGTFNAAIPGMGGFGAMRKAREKAFEDFRELYPSAGSAVGVATEYPGMPGSAATLGLMPMRARKGQTVSNPYREPLFPDIYKSPKVIAAEAAERTVPESPNLKKVFGVRRGDLEDIGKHGTRQGNLEPSDYLQMPPNARGSEMSAGIMTPRNEQRILDVLERAGKYEGLRHMDSWYVSDPIFQRMVKLVGREQAIKDYPRFNAIIGMHSPSTSPPDELMRGLFAHYMANEGRLPEYVKHGGLSDFNPKRPKAPHLAQIGIEGVPGHPWHSTAHAPAVEKFLEKGYIDSLKPKVPSYVAASGVPQTGFQTSFPVPDAHFMRGIGAADTRRGGNLGASGQMPEMMDIAPWWRKSIAGPMGKEAVPMQARAWGAFSPQTGVEAPIGPSKIEMLSDLIARRAYEHGIPIEKARDLILTGKMYARGGRAY